MANTTAQLKNVNLLTKARYDGISDLASNELYAVETPTIVETYSDDNGNWYRIYSDGWVEQGGTRVAQNNWETITFLKPFINANYTALTSNSAGGTSANSIRNKTATSMQIYQNWQYDWYACGQGE